MSDEWEFKSQTYDNCNCSVSCGCQFNEPTTNGNCHFAYVGTVVDGHFNDTPLAGLNWSLICKFPGEMAEGNAVRQIVIDERADEAQRNAMETIISGEACKPLSNHFAVFGSLCTEFCETLFSPIQIDLDLKGRRAKVDIPGILTSAAGPIINEFNGEDFHIAIARPAGSFEFTYGEIGRGSTTVMRDIEMAFEETWALFCVHHYNQDGMIRSKSGLTDWLRN
ncbi:MAG: DUF1326 domain-containing protein [Acidiferrobacterales bacterium]|nr:DUF1326 domain-containing protein [Acidiferrobacterales bacterium]